MHREAIKIQEQLHTVNVYRDCGRIFYSAYDPEKSQYRSCSVAVDQVNSLLTPNSVEASEFGARGAPADPTEMYHRLVALLQLEKRKTVGDAYTLARGAARVGPPRRNLVCRRRLTLLLRETRKMSGHLATVTVYEEAKGELRCHAYLPDFSAAIELSVQGKELKNLYGFSDPVEERDHVDSADAVR